MMLSICATESSGLALSIRAATPARWGVAMDVPLMEVYPPFMRCYDIHSGR